MLAASSDLVFAFYDPKIPVNRAAVSADISEAMMLGKLIPTNSESVLVSEIMNRERCRFDPSIRRHSGDSN